MRLLAQQLAQAEQVSIRTRSFDRVMRAMTDRKFVDDLFQSAPGLSTG